MEKLPSAFRRRDIMLDSFIYLVIAFTLTILFFTVKSTFFSGTPNNQVTTTAIQVPTMNRMSLTNYDKELAKKFMDKNNDGRCDACGMPIEQCIDSGQIQCNMDSDATIGVLQSQHLHADWKVYINGKEFDWSPYFGRHERQMAGDLSIKDTSAFIHIHSAQALERGGDVLHVHSTGVPLSMFFNSLNIKLPNSMNLYVNEKLNREGLDYVFKDGDKLLLTDATDQSNIQQQLSTITDFAKNH